MTDTTEDPVDVRIEPVVRRLGTFTYSQEPTAGRGAGVLPPFTGILGGPIRPGYVPTGPGLAYLTLDALVGPHLREQTDRHTRTETESVAGKSVDGTDDGSDDPATTTTVREFIQQQPSGETASSPAGGQDADAAPAGQSAGPPDSFSGTVLDRDIGQVAADPTGPGQQGGAGTAERRTTMSVSDTSAPGWTVARTGRPARGEGEQDAESRTAAGAGGVDGEDPVRPGRQSDAREEGSETAAGGSGAGASTAGGPATKSSPADVGGERGATGVDRSASRTGPPWTVLDQGVASTPGVDDGRDGAPAPRPERSSGTGTGGLEAVGPESRPGRAGSDPDESAFGRPARPDLVLADRPALVHAARAGADGTGRQASGTGGARSSSGLPVESRGQPATGRVSGGATEADRQSSGGTTGSGFDGGPAGSAEPPSGGRPADAGGALRSDAAGALRDLVDRNNSQALDRIVDRLSSELARKARIDRERRGQ